MTQKIVNSLPLLATLVFLKCNNTSPDCLSNVDCGAAYACVDKRCIDKKKDCTIYDEFVEGANVVPQHADEIEELHVVLDKNFVLHYCYWGVINGAYVSFYGRQIDHDTVIEEEILSNENITECGGIAVSKKGTVFLFSKNTAGILIKKEKSWKHVELKNLSSREAKGALYSQQTVATFNETASGGVFFSVSIGYGVDYQPIYISKITEQGNVKTVLNSWTEAKEPTIVGYAPSIATIQDDKIIVLNEKKDTKTLFMNTEYEIKHILEGNYPEIDIDDNETLYVIVLDRNKNGQLYKYADSDTDYVGTIGKIDFYRGPIPWKISVDISGNTHVLFEDKKAGINSLSYSVVKKNGKQTFERVLSNTVFGGVSGTQRYDIVTDICLRPKIALVEGSRFDTKIKLVEKK